LSQLRSRPVPECDHHWGCGSHIVRAAGLQQHEHDTTDVPPQAGQGQQSKGRGVLAFVVLLLAVIVAVSGITNLINGNFGGTLVCFVVTVFLWFGYKALSKGQ
jgi:hypothetical protein